MIRQVPISMLLMGGLLLASGCSGEAEDRPDVVPVSGTVMYNGETVAGATVTFMAEGAPRPATGITDAQGKFQLTMFEPNDGAMPGLNTITVMKREAAAAAAAPSSTPNLTDPSALAQMSQSMQAGSAEAPKALIPEIYNNASTTPLKETVTEDGENNFVLQLSD